MKTYIKPSVLTEHFELLNLMETSVPEPPRVGGTTISGGQAPLDYLKRPIL